MHHFLLNHIRAHMAGWLNTGTVSDALVKHLHTRNQIRDGVETEMAAATKEGKRAGRASKSASSGAVNKLAATSQSKYNRFEAEVSCRQAGAQGTIAAQIDKHQACCYLHQDMAVRSAAWVIV